MNETTDWANFDRLARRVAVAKAGLLPVRVAFNPGGRKDRTVMATWFGQVYGSLAVVRIGQTPPDCGALGPLEGYQLIHVPTGLYLRSHVKAHPLRALALALNDLGIDWAGMDGRGLAWLPEGQREEAQGVVRGWGERHGG